MKRRKCMADGGVLVKANERVRQAVGGIADFLNIGRPTATEVVSGGRTNVPDGQRIVQPDARPDMPQDRNPRRFAEEVDQRKQARSGGYARGGILPVLGIGSGTSDSIPVVLAGHKVKVSNGEGVAVLPKKTMDTPGAVAAVEDLIEQTNGKPPVPMADGGKYAAGALPEEDGRPKFLSSLPEGGILRTPQGRQQAAQAIANAPAIGAPLTIGGGQKPVTAQQVYGSSPPANDLQQRIIEGQGLRPDVGLTGPRAVPQQQADSGVGIGGLAAAALIPGVAPALTSRSPLLDVAKHAAMGLSEQDQPGLQQAGNYAPSRLSTGVIRRPGVQPGIPPATSPVPYSNEGRRSAIGSVNASPAATPAGGPTVAEVARQPQFPKPSEPVPSGTGFIRNSRTGAVTPVGSPLAESLAPQSVATPARFGVLDAIQPAAQPTDTNRYRQTAEKILLDESRGPGGGVAARLLMGMAGRAAGVDNDAARTANETQAVAARAQQAAAELASTDSYRRASLGIQDREQSMREQESADKLQDTAAQRAARAGIADAIESGDEAKIKKAQAKGIAAGVLKATDERKHEESPYRIHTDTTSGDQVRINQKTGATDRLDRATNTWQPVGASQPKQAPQAAIEYLRANPGTADQFKQRYGYLPQ